MCCSRVNVPPNHPGDVALIYRGNKGFADNQLGNTVKPVRLVLRPVRFDDSKWRTYLFGNGSNRF